ncbi:hypothetical protein F2P56_022060 [Juglans regia]|uniref:Extensin-like n=1 Tax=Juglans regia TaxID=51240 RepID=A0A833UJI3_JUGRE|nr:hypothetical protein F2P56_022060 [Juglans regia]
MASLTTACLLALLLTASLSLPMEITAVRFPSPQHGIPAPPKKLSIPSPSPLPTIFSPPQPHHKSQPPPKFDDETPPPPPPHRSGSKRALPPGKMYYLPPFPGI